MNFTMLDYILLILLLLAGFFGIKRGFFSSLGAIAGMVGGLIIAYQYREIVILALEENFGVRTLLTETLNRKIPALGTIETVKNQVGLMGHSFRDSTLPNPTTGFGISPVEHLATILLSVLVFLLLFLISSILLKLIFALLNRLFNHGALGFVNRFAGMLLEISKYAIIVFILIMISDPLLKTAAGMGFSGAETAASRIQESYLIATLLDIGEILQSMLGKGA